MRWFTLLNAENAVLLTPNHRLAATLLKQFNQQAVQQHQTCWKTPQILPFKSWLHSLWQDYTARHPVATPQLLTPMQGLIVWEDILRHSPESEYLLQLTPTAELAHSAWELLRLWQVDLNHPTLPLTEDSQAFQQWALQFEGRCQQQNWLDHDSLADYLQTKLSTQEISPPQRIILIGFAELPPQHQAVIDACQSHGCEIIHFTPEAKPQLVVNKIGLSDELSEIHCMARWAKHLYDQSPHKPPLLIGCVVPRLEALRDTILRVFAETFAENNSFTLDLNSLPFNISAGTSLATFPMIHAAFNILQLTANLPLPDSFNALLLSPFLGEAEKEYLRRADFADRLQDAHTASLTLNRLLVTTHSLCFTSRCPALTQRLTDYLNYRQTLPKHLPVSTWVAHFTELLTIIGWPGERSLNSLEYQVIASWQELLVEYQAFDHLLGPQSFARALNYLKQLAVKKVFQPKTPETPIQILGLLEAADLPFENIWVMGLDDIHWPAAPKPHPFIPQLLQKKLLMPRSTAERELIYSRYLMQQLQQNAARIIYSYPEKNEDAELRPSALLDDIAPLALENLSLSPYISSAEKIYAQKKLDSLHDENAPPLLPQEKIRGGAAIFKQQAACPFRAFAEFRLHAKKIETPALGLSAIDRGKIVHKALELIWLTLKNSNTLQALSLHERQTLVQDKAQEAIHQVADADFLQPRYLALELQRLEKMILAWLDIELARPAFSVVAQEHEMQATVGTIPITLRIDRIDELADGQHLLIDYKTGKNNHIKNWFSLRPDEPQLPLYSILYEKTCSIAFGQLHSDNMNLLGVSQIDLSIRTIKTLTDVSYATTDQWEQQITEWRAILTTLAEDFANGIATVDPKDSLQTCELCNLHTFCRIHEKL